MDKETVELFNKVEQLHTWLLARINTDGRQLPSEVELGFVIELESIERQLATLANQNDLDFRFCACAPKGSTVQNIVRLPKREGSATCCAFCGREFEWHIGGIC